MEYWAKKDENGKITTVESHSYPHQVPEAIKITKKEYDAYIASLPLPEPPKPPRDYGAEIDGIKAKLEEKGIL